MGRGNKIEVPIRDGQPAKMYLLAYPRRIKAYTLAERLFGRDPPPKKYANVRQGRVRQPNKIYNYLKHYPELFDKNEKGIISRGRPLAKQIEKTLEEKGQPLTPEEKSALLKFLDSPEFRAMIKPQEGLKEYDSPLQFFYITLGASAFYAALCLSEEKKIRRPPGLGGNLAKSQQVQRMAQRLMQRQLPGELYPLLDLGPDLLKKLSHLLPVSLLALLMDIADQNVAVLESFIRLLSRTRHGKKALIGVFHF
jgi:hypothetical protein